MVMYPSVTFSGNLSGNLEKIATTAWVISADLFAFTNNIKVIIPTVQNIAEDYHYVEAWFIGPDKNTESKSRLIIDK